MLMARACKSAWRHWKPSRAQQTFLKLCFLRFSSISKHWLLSMDKMLLKGEFRQLSPHCLELHNHSNCLRFLNLSLMSIHYLPLHKNFPQTSSLQHREVLYTEFEGRNNSRESLAYHFLIRHWRWLQRNALRCFHFQHWLVDLFQSQVLFVSLFHPSSESDFYPQLSASACDVIDHKILNFNFHTRAFIFKHSTL